jgi:hypothetical protein
LRLHRVKQGMTAAARTGGIFHLWWHPHNFGVDIEENLALLEAILGHYRLLSDTYGMQSRCMADFASSANPAFPVAGQALPSGAGPASHYPIQWGPQ